MTCEEIMKAPASEVATALAEHNRWRRGEGEYAYGKEGVTFPQTARELGCYIDRAVQILSQTRRRHVREGSRQ